VNDIAEPASPITRSRGPRWLPTTSIVVADPGLPVLDLTVPDGELVDR
jgi:hypothetical protein